MNNFSVLKEYSCWWKLSPNHSFQFLAIDYSNLKINIILYMVAGTHNNLSQ